MGGTGRTPSRRERSSVGTLELPQATPSRRKKVPVSREYVGIDLHRRRSVIVRKNSDGEVLSKVHIDNDPHRPGGGGLCRWPQPRGGARGHLRLVLGRGCPRRAGRQRPSESIAKRLAAIDEQLPTADPLKQAAPRPGAVGPRAGTGARRRRRCRPGGTRSRLHRGCRRVRRAKGAHLRGLALHRRGPSRPQSRWDRPRPVEAKKGGWPAA
jgi:hypothetical protein